MEKMTKKDKFRKFVNDHADEIAYVTGLAITVSAITTAIAITNNERKTLNADAMKAAHAWADGENQWLDSIHASGKRVYLLHDLTYAVIPEDTPAEWITDRPRKP